MNVNEEMVKWFIADALGLNEEDEKAMTEETNLDDLGMDSLALTDLLADLDDIGIVISEEKAASFETVGDVIKAVNDVNRL